MFNSPILDLAITLSFTYFILGLLVSTIHEFVFSVLMSKNPKRAYYLKTSIECLFFDSNWKQFATDKLFNSIHFQSLKSSTETFPSYVPNSNFALAVLDQFRDGNNLLDMGRIKDVLMNTDASTQAIPESLRKMLLSMYERANGELTEFQSQIESYFNSAMDRLGGSYVRSTKRYVLLIAAILACSLNVDTIHIVKTLWEHPDALKQTADNIQATVKEIESAGGTYSVKSRDGKTVELNTRFTTDSIDSNGIKHIKENIKTSVITLQNTGIPIGWDKSNRPQNKNGGECSPFPLSAWLIKVLGLLLTSFALLLGAPFWFDLLNKLVNVRAAGKKDADVDKPDAKPVQPVTVTINQPGEGAVG